MINTSLSEETILSALDQSNLVDSREPEFGIKNMSYLDSVLVQRNKDAHSWLVTAVLSREGNIVIEARNAPE